MRAFVLSGGASLGAVQAGMLAALYDRPEPIAPDLIVGTSAGAINGAYIASRPATAETAEGLAEIWRGLKRGDVFPLGPLRGLFGFIGLGSSLIGDSGLRKLLGREVEFERLEDAAIPLHVIAADLRDASEQRLSEGPTIEAVLASAAIPGVFPPVEVGERMLIDGGISNNTPISHAVDLGADEVYVLPSGYPCARQEVPKGALAMLLHAATLMTQLRLVREIDMLRDQARLVVLPPPCPHDVAPIDFGRAPELIERSREEAESFLDDCDDGSERVPLSMSLRRIGPHEHPVAS